MISQQDGSTVRKISTQKGKAYYCRKGIEKKKTPGGIRIEEKDFLNSYFVDCLDVCDVKCVFK